MLFTEEKGLILSPLFISYSSIFVCSSPSFVLITFICYLTMQKSTVKSLLENYLLTIYINTGMLYKKISKNKRHHLQAKQLKSLNIAIA